MIRFSDDWRGPGFGMLTKARGFDKWAHLAGSAAGVMLWIAGMRYICDSPEWFIHTIGLWIGMVVVFGAGLGIEIWQGRKKYRYEINEFFRAYSEGPPDGFSFLDLAADIAGILLVWGVIV